MRKLLAFAVLVGALAALPVVAMAQAAPSEGLFHAVILPAILRVVLDPTFLGILAALVLLLVKQKFAARAQFVEDAADKVFGIVEDMKAKGALPAGMSKMEVALKQFHDILAIKGVKPTDAEIALAKAAWSAAHGESKAAAPAPVVEPKAAS